MRQAKSAFPSPWRCAVLCVCQYWNASGRGYPDVAAQSEMFVVVQYGIPLPGVGGTSCASPTFSGVCMRVRVCVCECWG